MANKTMHHAVIGADTFELIDEAGREETSQLKNALNFETTDILSNKDALRIGINLIDPTKLTLDKILGADGGVVPSIGYAFSDYIPVNGNNICGPWLYSNLLTSYVVYDKNLDFLRSVTGNTVDNTKYTYQSGDAYIRVNYRPQFVDTACAFYGDVQYNYVAYQKGNLRYVHNDIAECETNIAVIEKKLYDITINDYKKVFASYEPHITGTGTTTFRAFATRYTYTGIIKKVGVYARFSGNATFSVTVQIRSGDFNTILAEKAVAVSGSDSNQTIYAEFDNEIMLNGDYYIAVIAPAGLVASTPNEASPETTATTSGTTQNRYILSSNTAETWAICGASYCLDVTLYRSGAALNDRITNLIYIGTQSGCDFPDVQTALNAIDDDTEQNPYVFVVMPGTYETFTMKYTNNERTTARTGGARWISLIGLDANNTVFFDNRGNYLRSPCEIWTNGTVKNISFIDKTDAEHHTQEQDRTFAYAVHLDFGTCKLRFENCYFYSNAGPGVGIGTYKDELLEFYNCRFETDVDGTYGTAGHGAFFAHTQTAGTSASDRTNQNLRVHDSVAIATGETNGARLAVIAGYEGTYKYELQNFGSIGNAGPAVSLQAPDSDLLSNACFNNVPSTLNTVI